MAEMGGERFIGWHISLFTVTAGLSRLISGKLADTVGRLPVMIFGAIICLIAGIAYPLVNTIYLFLLLRLFHGLSTGFKPTGTAAYIADIIPAHRRGEAIGILGVFLSLGMAAGPALSTRIVDWFSMETLFYISGAVGALSGLVVVWMKESLPEPKPFKINLLKPNVREAFEPAVLAPAIVMVIAVVPFGIILTIIPDYSGYLGINDRGIFFFIFTLASLVIRIFAGKASDKFGRVTVLLLSTTTIAVSMVLLAYSASFLSFAVAAIVFGVGVGMNSPTIFAWAIDLSFEHTRGRAMATVFIALEIGIFCGSLLAGRMYQNDPEMFFPTFLTGGVICLLAFVYLVTGLWKKVPTSKSESSQTAAAGDV